FGNPGSLHSFGQDAIAGVDHAREIIATAINADFREIIFTGSATEANNLALRGAVDAARRAVGARGGFSVIEHPRVILSAIEHESVLEGARALERDGAEVVIIPVHKEGIIDIKKLQHAITAETVLVSVMVANNEIGSIQPIAEIGSIINHIKKDGYPLFH